jgi:hypothetical protein
MQCLYVGSSRRKFRDLHELRCTVFELVRTAMVQLTISDCHHVLCRRTVGGHLQENKQSRWCYCTLKRPFHEAFIPLTDGHAHHIQLLGTLLFVTAAHHTQLQQ